MSRDELDPALRRLLAVHRAVEADRRPVASTSAAAEPSGDVASGDLALPAPAWPAASLPDILRRRRSRYAFARRPLDVEVIGSLLGGALGVSRRIPAYGDPEHPLGVAPCSGGLGAVHAYLVAARVTGIAPGVYRYRTSTHTLRPVPGAAPEELAQAYEQPEFAERAAASLLLTVELGRAVVRYGARHYRVLHIDAGIATQNLYLVATALDLACCAVAGFTEAPLRHLAALPDTELPALLFPIGWRH
ncbi:MAG: SagB family peptide dehydrogenase [Pseudonocardiales bacterium]